MSKFILRMREISKELKELEEKGDLTSADEKRCDELIQEFEELRRAEGISDIDSFMKESIDKPMKPDIGGSDVEPGIKFYNRSNLGELRSFIQSQDKLGITEPVSAGKYIRGLITGEWQDAEIERRISSMTTLTGGAGWIIPEIISAIIIPLALNKAMVFKAGCQTTPMESQTLVIPKITKVPAHEWKGESIKFAEDTTMTFSGITLRAKTLMALIKISVELAQDGLNVENVIEEAMSDAIALALDLAVLSGIGGLEPKGIIQTDGILSEDLENAEISSYDFLSRAYWKLEAENELASGLIAPSSMFADLDLLKDLDNNRLQPPLSWEGSSQKPSYLKLSSNQLSDSAVMGDFSKVLVGMRTDLQIKLAETGEGFEKLEIWIRAYLRADVGIKREKAFCHIKNYGLVAS
ncbi:hypothetical protein ES703_26491 [subsurface metagenome]